MFLLKEDNVVYLLKKNNEDTLDIVFTEEDVKNKVLYSLGTKMLSNWGIPLCHWYTDDDAIDYHEKDFFMILGYIPVCTEAVKLTLSRLISEKEVEFLPIMINECAYFIINPLIKYDGIVNLAKSKVDYFTDGSIMWIKKFVFYPKKYLSSFFMIEELSSVVFVSEFFKKKYDESGFKGLEFVPCMVKNKSFLDSLFK